jgi:monoamine oxidase
MSVVDRLDELGLGPPERELVRWLWSQNFNGPCSEGALSLALRWDAFGGYDWLGLLEACARFKIVGGTRRLLEAIVGDAAATVHLSSPVARIAQSETEVVVRLRDGRELTGAAALVTVPVNALDAIEFAPPLSSAKRAAIEEGQLSQGVKAWVHIRGAGAPFLALASDEHPLVLLQYERATSDGYLAFAFGADARKLDRTDGAIEDAVRIWLPDAQVVEWACHDWVADEFSRETWATFRPGWLTRHAEALQEPEGRVLLSGSDYANGWVGFIDGAIESGIRVARQISEVIDADLSARWPCIDTEGRDP